MKGAPYRSKNANNVRLRNDLDDCTVLLNRDAMEALLPKELCNLEQSCSWRHGMVGIPTRKVHDALERMDWISGHILEELCDILKHVLACDDKKWYVMAPEAGRVL